MRLKFTTVLLLFLSFILVNGEITVEAKEHIVNNESDFQHVLDQAKDNDVILVEPGTYEGNFTIDRSITVIGKEGAIIKGPNQGDVITVIADDVTIENLQIEGSGTQNAGISLRSNRNIIKNNKLYDTFHGVLVKDGYGNEITKNLITSFKETSNKGFGVYLIKSPHSKVNNNLMYGTNDGIYISFSDLCEIGHNQIKNARYGVHTMDSKNVVITQNHISNSRNGLMLMQSYNLQVNKNHLYANTTVDGAGMFLFDTFNSNISANVMKMNNKGIYLENAVDNRFEFNLLEGNEKGVEISKDSTGNQINLNNFIGNNQQVISEEENENEFSFDEYGNFWDDQQSLNINQDELNDYAYKSGDVFYHLITDEPTLQIFTGSPAVRLWNTVEQFVPFPSKQFIIDEHPLNKPASIQVETIETSKKTTTNQIAWKPLILFLGFVLFGFIIMRLARRKQYAK